MFETSSMADPFLFSPRYIVGEAKWQKRGKEKKEVSGFQVSISSRIP